MTWLYDPDGNSVDVYDHDETQVATDREITPVWSTDRGYPPEVLTVMRESFETGGPTAYNQQLLRDAATENIEEGVP